MPPRIASAMEEAYAQSPALQRHFKSWQGMDFWGWANTDGLFLNDAVRQALPGFPQAVQMSAGSNEASAEQFARSGTRYYLQMEQVLNRLGRSWDTTPVVLDFGCGIGRVSRLFARGQSRQRFLGYDLTEMAIDWLRTALPWGEFQVGFPAPPLPLADDSLDVIFSISVFTHLKEPSQDRWLAEFRRVLRPGGVLLQTVHGRHAMNLSRHYKEWQSALHVSDRDWRRLQDRFARDGFAWVPHSMQTTGTNDYGVSFQTEQFIASRWARHLSLVGVWAGEIDGWQDLVALQKTDRPVDPPALPPWPGRPLPPVQSVTLCPAQRTEVRAGEPFVITAHAQAGEDVHYKFFLVGPGNMSEAITGWQAEAQVRHTLWLPGQYGVIAHACSGPGPHPAHRPPGPGRRARGGRVMPPDQARALYRDCPVILPDLAAGSGS